MATSHGMPVITLGWQTWSVVVVVLTIALIAAAFVLLQ